MKTWRVPYPKFGDGPGLARVAAVAERLGVSLSGFGTQGVVIVGSNGKGSTAAMCAALLRQAARPVGLFTSPHLFSLSERFNIDGEDISDEELDLHWTRVITAIDSEGLSTTIGGFEFLFLVAADWFATRGCVHTVWEAGIGGRLDPVKLIEAQRVALTALDVEHTELLGETLEEIARDKSEATPRGGTLFIGEAVSAQRRSIEDHCIKLGVRTAFIENDGLGRLHAPLDGPHQIGNAALALALSRDLVELGDEAARAGFAATRWQGRLEMIGNDPRTIIDVGHTPDAIRVGLEGYHDMRGGLSGVLVCGASRDKDAAAIISALAPSFPIIICAAAAHKGAPAAEIAAYAHAANPRAEILLAESVADARRLAMAKARATQAAVYVAGGLFLAAEYKAVDRGRDPAALDFF
ncbi:MAG: bifunctional folylpolyglutamate synthase/dihydrofolate synthase [Actinobacteria bacterium]|nr:bifunctional folylpolyglutamate synthase/dihydrofolate synthase [Actinomycetota bacterium]MCB8997900.1 bifunctional folylpolyglutamate synthase/dihydrofolate synthase [Actinomycetota bacterium]MCB9423951.1 bifunctional folylpolyglutamate synthase/dihydrofolate synthase [Actinomycetota bacterium]